MKGIIHTTDDGFTFIETIIVLAITVILSAGIGIPAMKQIERAKKIAAKSQIETFRIALQSYYLDCNQYPTETQTLESLYTKPLIHPVPESWDGPYIDRLIPKDPWGNNYVYQTPGPDGLPYSVQSFGADGKEGGSSNDKDISSWE